MGDLRDAFDVTAKSLQSATGAGSLDAKRDAALIEAGRKIADEIDHAVDNLTGQERTKALYLVPHLMNVLREMYATPKARHEAGLSEKGGGDVGALGKLRLAHGKGA